MFFIEFLVWRYNQRKLALFKAQDREAQRQASLKNTESQCDADKRSQRR